MDTTSRIRVHGKEQTFDETVIDGGEVKAAFRTRQSLTLFPAGKRCGRFQLKWTRDLDLRETGVKPALSEACPKKLSGHKAMNSLLLADRPAEMNSPYSFPASFTYSTEAPLVARPVDNSEGKAPPRDGGRFRYSLRAASQRRPPIKPRAISLPLTLLARISLAISLRRRPISSGVLFLRSIA